MKGGGGVGIALLKIHSNNNNIYGLLALPSLIIREWLSSFINESKIPMLKKLAT